MRYRTGGRRGRASLGWEAVALAWACLLIALGFASVSYAAPKKGGIYRRALFRQPESLDPAQATSSHASAVMHQVFDGLVEFDGERGVRPGLARFWHASQDGRVWTFQLHQDVRFHHGRHMTAHDVVYSFTRLLDPKHHSPRYWLFMRVKGAEAFRAGRADHVSGFEILDSHTLRITLKESYAPFIHQLSIAAAKIVPEDEVLRLGDAFGRHPVGTGPFHLAAWDEGGDIRLQAHDAYFGQPPYLDQLHFRIFQKGALREAFQAFQNGELEETKVPVQERQRLLKEPGRYFVEKPLLATLFLLLDTQAGPLQHPKVRQAVNYAIDRESINTHIRKGRFPTAEGILPLGMPGYNFDMKGYPYDAERALRLLAEAGYPGGKGLSPLELWSSSTSKTAQAEHAAIKRALERIGMTVHLRTASSWQAYKRDVIGKRPGGMYRYAWYADFPEPSNFLYTLFHSSSPGNYIHYTNAEVDRLLETAQREIDQQKRDQLYHQAEALIMQDAPTVNIVYYQIERFFQTYVKGLDVRSMTESNTRMEYVWLER